MPRLLLFTAERCAGNEEMHGAGRQRLLQGRSALGLFSLPDVEQRSDEIPHRRYYSADAHVLGFYLRMRCVAIVK